MGEAFPPKYQNPMVSIPEGPSGTREDGIDLNIPLEDPQEEGLELGPRGQELIAPHPAPELPTLHEFRSMPNRQWSSADNMKEHITKNVQFMFESEWTNQKILTQGSYDSLTRMLWSKKFPGESILK